MIRLKSIIAFSVTLACILAISVCAMASTVSNPIPDTGQTQSYTNTFGEDSDYTINPPSYTKLDELGNALSDDATEWTTVRDNVTGLIWEMKTDDSSIHDKDNTYNWENAQGAFINALKDDNYGSFSDWRLPTIKELSSIVNSGTYNPAINTNYFPNTMPDYYQSSDVCIIATYLVWCTHFHDGSANCVSKSLYHHYVRAVCGGQQSSSFTDNGNGTVTDTSTGLMWQQTPGETTTWEAALIYCENLSLGGYNDWRLPNKNELQSLVDYALYSPAIKTAVFPCTESFGYWSSTTDNGYNSRAWCINFSIGLSYCNEKSYNHYVRAVRGSIPNQSPDCSQAYPSSGCLWPPNHQMVSVNILGITDPDGDPVTINIISITSDEPTASDKGSGGAKYAPDALGVGTDTAKIRSERSGDGNGRVYVISFTANDSKGGECAGNVKVKVPHDQSSETSCTAIDSGQNYDATQIN